MELSDRARELRNAAARKYRKEHPEKIREYNRLYWEKKADPVGVSVRKLSAKGMSQRQIAEQLNISLGTVNAILNTD
jgi:DNA-binding NarL/FixJ family response regulator